MGTIAKFTFLNCLFWLLVGSLVTRFTEFINFVEVGGWLGLENLAGMFSSFLSSKSSTNTSRKGEIRFFQKSVTKGIVICTTDDLIFNEVVLKIFEFTLNFFSSLIKSWKLLPESCLCEKCMTENGYIFPWVAVLRKFIQNRC